MVAIIKNHVAVLIDDEGVGCAELFVHPVFEVDDSFEERAVGGGGVWAMVLWHRGDLLGRDFGGGLRFGRWGRVRMVREETDKFPVESWVVDRGSGIAV